jgi:hypothetical protein
MVNRYVGAWSKNFLGYLRSPASIPREGKLSALKIDIPFDTSLGVVANFYLFLVIKGVFRKVHINIAALAF